MSFLDKLKLDQLKLDELHIDRIKCDTPSDDALVWKYPSEEIKLGSQLVVNESQEALFVRGGKALDLFGPGTHTLVTGNIPLLNALVGKPFDGKTPFTAEIWYANKTVNRDLKWGTQGPIQVIDPVYTYPVSVRAFGRWGVRLNDVRAFITQLVGSQSHTEGADYFSIDRLVDYFSGTLNQQLSDRLAEFIVDEKVSAFQIQTKLNELSDFVKAPLAADLAPYGVELVNFNVERISIPDEDQKQFQTILAKRMEIEQIGQANVGQAYTTMRSFDTMDKAAENSSAAGALLSGGLGLGLGMGAGTRLGAQLGANLDTEAKPSIPADAASSAMAKLQELKQLLDASLITQAEFDAKRAKVLDAM